MKVTRRRPSPSTCKPKAASASLAGNFGGSANAHVIRASKSPYGARPRWGQVDMRDLPPRPTEEFQCVEARERRSRAIGQGPRVSCSRFPPAFQADCLAGGGIGAGRQRSKLICFLDNLDDLYR
jgi:hypothetical protein